jgi:hypothetical protein
MSVLSQPQFHDEAAAFAFVEAELWPNGPICHHCGGCERISAITPNPAKRMFLRSAERKLVHWAMIHHRLISSGNSPAS